MECKDRNRAADCDGKPLEEDIERKRRRVLSRSDSAISSGTPQHENIRALRDDVDMLKKSMSNVEKLLVAIASYSPPTGLTQQGAEGIRGYASYLSF